MFSWFGSTLHAKSLNSLVNKSKAHKIEFHDKKNNSMGQKPSACHCLRKNKNLEQKRKNWRLNTGLFV